MQFTTYCNQEPINHNRTTAITSGTKEKDVADCMNVCASSNSGNCFGIWYDDEESYCYQLDRSVYNATRTDSDTINLALAHYSQWTPPKDLSCPFENGATYTTDDGQEFEILCDTDFGGYADMCAYNFGPYKCHPHADTLEECLDYCSKAHPLCQGVSWNGNMEYGWDKCYLKTDPRVGGVPSAPSGGKNVEHSAQVTRGYADISSNYCPEDLTYTAGNDDVFKINCYDGRFNAVNYTSAHESSIHGCMDRCSTDSHHDCAGILSNIDLKDGWSNCYLLSDVGVQAKPFNYTSAELATRSSCDDGDAGPGSSKAWIAGPVIGVTVLTALTAGIFWWFRRRSRHRQSQDQTFDEMYDTKQQPEVIHEAGTSEERHMLDAEPRTHELRDPKTEALIQHELEG
jgi:hypothetical protein